MPYGEIPTNRNPDKKAGKTQQDEQIDGQTDRQTDTETDTQTDIQTNRQKDTPKLKDANIRREKHTGTNIARHKQKKNKTNMHKH